MKRFLHLLSNALPLCAALLVCLPATISAQTTSPTRQTTTSGVTGSIAYEDVDGTPNTSSLIISGSVSGETTNTYFTESMAYDEHTNSEDGEYIKVRGKYLKWDKEYAGQDDDGINYYYYYYIYNGTYHYIDRGQSYTSKGKHYNSSLALATYGNSDIFTDATTSNNAYIITTYDGIVINTYDDMANVLQDSNLGKLLKDYGYNVSDDDNTAWTGITKLTITANSELNFGDFIVISYLSGFSKLYLNDGYSSIRGTNGNLTELVIDDNNAKPFVVETKTKCDFYYDYGAISAHRTRPNSMEYVRLGSKDDTNYDFSPMKTTDLPGGSLCNTKLKKVTLPTSLTGIGAMALRYSGIEEIDIHKCENLTDIGNGAFGRCYSLKKVVLPRSDMNFYGGVFNESTSYGTPVLAEIYINSKITEKTESKSNFTGVPSTCKLWVPVNDRKDLMTYYRENSTENLVTANFKGSYYPTLVNGIKWRSFSFDQALDYSGNIYSLFDTEKYVQAKRVSKYDSENRTFTVSAGGKYVSDEGVLILDENEKLDVDREFYPVPAASTASTPTNYLKGSGHGTLSVPTHGSSTTNFILKNGDFYYSTGGTLAMYKSYLQLPENIEVASDKNSAKGFTMIFDNTTGISDINASPMAAANGAIYNLQGVRVASGDDAAASLPAGVYIKNGRKFIVK